MSAVVDVLHPDTTVEEAQKNLEAWKRAGEKDAVALNPPFPKPHDAPETESISGLSPEHVKQAINLNLQAVVLGYHQREHIGYTERSPYRWDGIRLKRLAWKGQFPAMGDCSGFASWGKWCAFHHFHHSDTVNGERWLDGYTGTEATHGVRVHDFLPGDLLLYGEGWPFLHVTTYTGGGLCVSHGGSIGPLLLPVHYRGDLAEIRRYF